MNITKLTISLRASFWFLPAMIVTFFLALALVLIEVDSHNAYEITNTWPRLFGAGAEGSRGMLSTIATSILTMMGLTFSMTLVTLSIASSQYSSRVLRNFISNRGTQFALGTFAGIFTYCLVVLRTIKGNELSFIPSVSIFVGFVLALFGVGVIIYFIHHIASSIQASSVISNAAEETIRAMAHLYPSNETAHQSESQPPKKRGTYTSAVVNTKSGYIQTIDESSLCDIAESMGASILIQHQIGDFVLEGVVLLQLDIDRTLSHLETKKILEAFSIQRFRTIEQDPLFGIRQIVDIALKALSPGLNDSTTAIVCIDYLTSVLAFLIKRRIPPDEVYRNNALRLIVNRPRYIQFLRLSYFQIIKSGQGNFAVQERIISSLRAVMVTSNDPDRWQEFLSFTDLVFEVVDQSFTYNSEKSDLKQQIQDLRSNRPVTTSFRSF